MSYRKNPPTDDEIQSWLENKKINPRTGRKIMINGPTYKLLNKAYNISYLYDGDIISIDDEQSNSNILNEVINNNNNVNTLVNQIEPPLAPKQTYKNLKQVQKEQISSLSPINMKQDEDIDCDPTENYKSFRIHKVDPIMHENMDKPWAFKFSYKWNPYSGERIDEEDENGPLYFDPEDLVDFWYKNRMNNLWKQASDEEGGYFHGYYGDAVGTGPDFNIKGRGTHLEWYLFRLPIPDCYLDEEHNSQYITMGPIVSDIELKIIDMLVRKKNTMLKKPYKYKPSLVKMKGIYETCVNKKPFLGFERNLEPFLEPEDLEMRRNKVNRDAVDELLKFN